MKLMNNQDCLIKIEDGIQQQQQPVQQQIEWDVNNIIGEVVDQDEYTRINDNLYEYIRPPNPLIEKGTYMNNEVRTAHRLNFIKLPSIMNEYDEDNVYVEEKIIGIDKALKADMHNPKTTRIMPNHDSESNQGIKTGKTLYQLYPEGDNRQVYRRYKKQKNIELEDRIYASYFIDINNILKSTKSTKLQYTNDNNVMDNFNNNEEYKQQPQNDNTTLIFNSCFESGNLFAAYKITNNEYDLILQNDINSKGNTQWFFFSISNTTKDAVVKFNIVNMMKSDSLFNNGMKPVIFSTIENKKNGIEWQREGCNICYYKNHITREYPAQINGYQTYYTLTFTHKFKYNQDIVYIAQCYPYTYSQLNDYLNKLCIDNRYKHLINRKVLCKTLAQNNCEYLTITSNKNIENIDQRYGVFFSARQHPGESISSYMMQGIIDYLTSPNDEADFLRLYCIFKIIPMLNPDGVIHGNYRSSLSGVDLNRRWKKTNKILYPTIYSAKALLRKFHKERDLQLILDLHGHSRKTNTFIYGCTNSSNRIASRIFPFIFSKMSSTFSFKDSRFVIQKSKESTARVALWKEFKIPNIFTLEASFYGYEQDGKYFHYTKQDYVNIGKDICKTFYVYLTQVVMGISSIPRAMTPHENKDNNTIKSNIAFINSNMWLEELKNNKELIDWGEKSDDSGSDSNPSEDDLLPEEISKLSLKAITPKKEKMRSPSNMNFIKKIEKATIGTNTGIIIDDDSKRLRPKTLEKSISRRKSARKVMIQIPLTDTCMNPTNMVDKQTQTDDFLSENQNFECANETSFLTETRFFYNERRESIRTHESKLDKELKVNINANICSSFVMPLTNQPLINLSPQIQFCRLNNFDKQNDKIYNSNNNNNNNNMRAASRSNRQNQSGTRYIPMIIAKNKGSKYCTDGDLWIKGRKFEENCKEIKLIDSDIDSCLYHYSKNGEKILNTSEQSLIYKNMTTPRIANVLRTPLVKQANPRPITVSNIGSPRDLSFSREKEYSPGGVPSSKYQKSQHTKKSKLNEILTNNNTKSGINTSRNIPICFRSSVKTKTQFMSPSRQEIETRGNLRDLKNVISKGKPDNADISNKLRLNSKSMGDSTEYKNDRLFNMLTGLNACKNLLIYTDDPLGKRNLIKLKDLSKTTKDKMALTSKDELNTSFNGNRNKGEITFKDVDINQFSRTTNKFYKDEWQNNFWAFGAFKGQGMIHVLMIQLKEKCQRQVLYSKHERIMDFFRAISMF